MTSTASVRVPLVSGAMAPGGADVGLPTSPAAALKELLNGKIVARAICVAASLRIADLLANGPRTAAALADATGADADAIYRLLRALAAQGIFAESEEGRFTLTPLAEPLRSDVPESVRELAILFGSEWHWAAWGALERSVRTGKSAFEHVHGTNLFGYLAAHPDAQLAFDKAMTSRPDQDGRLIVKAYDFSGARRVVDVGGGHGELLAAVLAANPQAHGVLFDLPAAAQAAAEALHRRGVGERCELVGGDFFEGVPADGDAYLLRSVIHDWDDEAAARIIANCRAACPAEGVLLLIETVIEPGNRPCFAKLLDLEMLVGHGGGRERTRDEFAELLNRSGFQFTRIVETAGVAVVIEARPTS